MRALLRLLLASLAIAGASTAHSEEPAPAVRFGVLASAQTILSGDTDPAVLPGFRLTAQGPLALGGSTPFELYALLELTGLPGETVNLGEPATFKAARMDVGLARVVGKVRRGDQTIRTLLFVEGGFATRLPRDPGPVDRYPRRLLFGVRFEEAKSGASLGAAYGRDGAAGVFGWGQLLVSGQVPVYEVRENLDVILGGDAVLTLGKRFYDGAQRDIFRAWVGVRAGR